jgi:hypothetical protein
VRVPYLPNASGQGRFRSVVSVTGYAEKADQLPWRHASVMPHASDNVDAYRIVATAKQACRRQWVGRTRWRGKKWRGAERVARQPVAWR